ncbi:MAG: T9SS type A sorting domain-containing protein, partial [Bacteroidota bacterium]
DQNYPNPFNPSTVIRFSLPKEGAVKLQVFDITGSLVKTLLDEGVRAGNKEVVWDGTNETGVKVASGMYLYRLESASFVATRKMLLLK